MLASSSPLTFYGIHENINNAHTQNHLRNFILESVTREMIKKPHVVCRHSIWLMALTLWPRHLPPAGTSVTSCKKTSRSSRSASTAESSTVIIWLRYSKCWASQVALVAKNLSAKAGDIRDTASIPGLGRSPGGRHGNPLQYSCLENPKDRGAWRATVPGVAKSQTRLERLSMHACKLTWLSHKLWLRNRLIFNLRSIRRRNPLVV